MSEFLHGVQTIREKADSAVYDTDISKVCVVGTAPIFELETKYQTINKPVPIRGYSDVKKYAGNELNGFTLPDALNTILTESEGATIYMINVFDPAVHKKTETKTVNLTEKAYTLTDYNIKNLVVKNGNDNAVLNTDYTVENNVITVTTTGALKNASDITITYECADVTGVTAQTIIGTTDANGNRTGIQAMYDVQALYGDEIGILGAPVYSANESVRTQLDIIGSDLKAQVYTDVPFGTSVNDAIEARLNPTQNLNLECTSNCNMICFPYLKRYNSYSGQNELKPPSPVAMGLRVLLDRNRNVAKSITNTKSKTTVGVEIPIQFILNKANTESNALNSKGITTFINYKGGYHIWGTRNCNFPSEEGIETFESVLRTANFIEKSIETSSFPLVGESITQGFIDDVLEMIDTAFQRWKNPQNQIIIDGRVWYDKNDNPSEQLANGEIHFNYEFCPPCVAEKIMYRSSINIKLLKSLGGNE